MMIYDKLKYILLNKLNINFIFLNLILMKFVIHKINKKIQNCFKLKFF